MFGELTLSSRHRYKDEQFMVPPYFAEAGFNRVAGFLSKVGEEIRGHHGLGMYFFLESVNC